MSTQRLQLQLISSVILIGSLFLLINPFKFILSSNFQLILILIFAITFGIFFILSYWERARTLEDEAHHQVADRFAYLIGISLIALATLIESLQHRLDIVLPIVLAVMIMVRLFRLISSSVEK